MAHGAIALTDLQDRRCMRLVITCEQCQRRGIYSVRRLIEAHGEDTGLPDLRAVLTADCPARRSETGLSTCGAIYPELGRLFDVS